MKLNMFLQRCLRLQMLKTGSIKHVRNLCNLQKSKNVTTLPRCINVYLNPLYFPSNFNSVNKFSTTDALLKAKDRGKEKKKSQHKSVNLNEVAEVTNAVYMISQFDKAVEDFKDQLVKHVGLRSSVGAVEELVVEYDGDEYKLQELVEISRKPKMIVMNVSGFPQTIPSILETLSKSQMNLNPQQEGTTLYIPLPKVTKEHRENLVQRAKSFFVKCKDNITHVRNKHVKEVKRNDKAPVDLIYRVEGHISALSHEYIGKAEKLLETKQKELLREE